MLAGEGSGRADQASRDIAGPEDRTTDAHADSWRGDNWPVSAPASDPTSDAPSATVHVARGRRGPRWLYQLTVQNTGAAVHGALLAGVMLAAEDAGHEHYPETIAAAATVIVLYWLAGVYSATVATRLRERDAFTAAILWHSCAHELPVIEGGLVPILVLLIAAAAGANVTVGVAAAVWAAALAVLGLELATDWRARGSGRFWLRAGAGVALSLAIVAVKLLLH